ncbi:MAG: VWA domain-containing protein [Planctomycetota bacterium]|nr:VWA domain-containing protein [Planctomycetota bacterium]
MFHALPTFEFPLGLLLAPLLALGVWWQQRKKHRPAAIFSSVEGLRGLPVTFMQRLKRLLPWLQFLGLLCLSVALARPQRGVSETLVRTEGVAIEAALDISGSMDAMDFALRDEAVTRMEAVKHVFAEFVSGDRANLPGRPNDAIGLVAFGGYADSRCPLTLDHGALLDVVSSLETPKPVTDRHGNVLNQELWKEESLTAIGDAIALSIERLEQVQAKSKMVLLLTDGVSNAGVIAPKDAVALARQKGVKIYTIGIGRNGLAPFKVPDGFGGYELEKARVEFDDTLLKDAAEATGGRYFHADNTEALKGVYAEIDRLERSITEKAVYMEYHELYAWPLALGVLLLLLQGLLASTRFRTLP